MRINVKIVKSEAMPVLVFCRSKVCNYWLSGNGETCAVSERNWQLMLSGKAYAGTIF